MNNNYKLLSTTKSFTEDTASVIYIYQITESIQDELSEMEFHIPKQESILESLDLFDESGYSVIEGGKYTTYETQVISDLVFVIETIQFNI